MLIFNTYTETMCTICGAVRTYTKEDTPKHDAKCLICNDQGKPTVWISKREE